MEAKSLTLDDLTNLFDDVDPEAIATEDASAYADAPPPTPVSGKQEVMLCAIDVDRDMAGTVRNVETFTCNFRTVEGRQANFVKVSMVSKKRGDKRYNELVDLCRGFDKSFDWDQSPAKALRFLLQCIADRTTAFVQFDWKAWDYHYATQQGFAAMAAGPEKKALADSVSIRGVKRFDADGTYLNPVSGNLLKAKPYISKTYPRK